MVEKLEKLLFTWIQSLSDLQISSNYTELDGGILCPSCSRVHGRSIDAMYSFMYYYEKTGDKSYYNSAMRLYSWTSQLKKEDGSWNNDLHIVDWNGISVFNLITILETLKDFGYLLTKSDYNLLYNEYINTADFVYNTFSISTGNINYPASAAHALYLAFKLYGDEKYSIKAKTLVNELYGYFSDDGILYGEGYPQNSVSKKGCRPIDIAYNLDESLPNLLGYAINSNDEKLLSLLEKSYKEHSKFFLQDGGIDNSWCSRNYKWTYYGSRTSDGCLLGLLLAKRFNSSYLIHFKNNFKLLKNSTRNGILYGGPGYRKAGKSPCIHHTICHSKNIALALKNIEDSDSDFTINESKENMVPGLKVYSPDFSNVMVVKGNGWRFTLSDYDWIYTPGSSPSGGALTLLYHEKFGIIFAAGLNHDVMPERFNMQSYNYKNYCSSTPRIQIEIDGITYSNIDTLDAETSYKGDSTYFTYSTNGFLNNQIKELKSKYGYSIKYEIESINFCVYPFIDGSDGTFILPVIELENDIFLYKKNSINIKRGGHELEIILENGTFEEVFPIDFNFQPGFVFRKISVNLKQSESLLKLIFKVNN